MNQFEQIFITKVWEYYRAHGRHDLPWRKTRDPYRILVSEVMLQQTQVVRVIPKYQSFLYQFPSTKALASASLGDVLRAWQGLGYNRRAKYLHEAATIVHKMHHGRWPRRATKLISLPGIGPYTAGAVAAFAYNEPVSIIETNIRTVYLHHFFPGEIAVGDQAIMELVIKTLDRANPREWYWALMDYGAYIKQLHGSHNHRSRSYIKQSRFIGSARQVRGRIINALLTKALNKRGLTQLVRVDSDQVIRQLETLVSEGLVVQDGDHYRLP